MNKYKEYILSDKWKLKKQEVFKLRGKECEQCGSIHKIHVHHITYKNLGNENMEDLQILCFQCHMSKHDKYFNKLILNKNPKIKKKQVQVKRKKPIRDKKYKDEKLLASDFKTLNVGDKRKYLILKGYNPN